MGEAAKKICFASVKDQSCQVWKGFVSKKGLGDAEGKTNLDLDLKLGISNVYSAQASDNHDKNRTFDHVENNLIHGTSSTPAVGVKLAIKMQDPKRLRRIMANRVSSKKYRMKKLHHMDRLENQINVLRVQISNIRQQIEKTKTKQRSLLIEQHHLKFRIATVEKERIVKEVEIGKNKAEMTRLRELYISQLQAKQHATPNSDDGSHAVNAKLDLNLGL